MANVEDILLPDVGDFSGIPIIEVLVAPGDRVEADQSLLTLESDKATMEIPSPKAGVITEVLVKIGDTVSQGNPLFRIDVGADGAQPTAAPRAASQPLAPSADFATKPPAPAVAPSAAPPAAAPPASTALVTFTLPDIGDFHDVPVVEILVKPGDRVEMEQSLLTLETDKATMEIPSTQAGVVESVAVTLGQTLNRGDLILTLRAEGGQTAGAQAPMIAPTAPSPATVAAASASPAPITAAAAVPAAGANGVPVPMNLPDIGDFHDVPVVEVLVKAGDRVAVDQSILTLETDKATMEIPATQAGVVESVAVTLGQTLNQGDLILTLRPDDPVQAEPPVAAPAELANVPAAPALEEIKAQTASPQTRAPGESKPRQAPVLPRPADMAAIAVGRKAHASPTVRRFARELGVDLTLVKGSGPKGRVRRDDVQGFVKLALTQGAPATARTDLPFALPSAPPVDFAKFGPVEVKALSRIQRLSGRHLHRAWLSVPHVTQFEEADITALEDFRKGQKDAATTAGVRLSVLPFLLKAAATALRQMPIVKSSLTADGESLVMKGYTHIGVAVDTPNGLLVPVIRDVDTKGIFDLARDLSDLSQKARDGKLLAADMQGGCFSISSLGGIGGTKFTPIVNAPEVAILGVSRAEMKPVWTGSDFAPRLMLPLSLSYDHRVIDGAVAARFTLLLRQLLGDIRTLLL